MNLDELDLEEALNDNELDSDFDRDLERIVFSDHEEIK